MPAVGKVKVKLNPKGGIDQNYLVYVELQGDVNVLVSKELTILKH